MIYNVCPHCGYETDMATDVNDKGAIPTNGDYSVCIRCGEVSVFDDEEEGGLRRPSFKEEFEMASNDALNDVVRLWRSLFKKGSSSF